MTNHPIVLGRRESLVGILVSFVAAVEMIRWVRIDLLLDSEPSWQPARLLLFLAILLVALAPGVVSAALCSAVGQSKWGQAGPIEIPLGRATLVAICVAAIGVGALLRIAALDWVPDFLWIDDASEIAPTLALHGSLSDVPPWAYPAPFFEEGKPTGSVGTVYLELLHLSLRLFGTTVWGLRAPAAMAGVASLVTASLLGRALLPRGGAALTALVLAGLRWHLTMTRWGWNAVALIPLLDVAALLLLRARRRPSPVWAALSGALVGLGAHIHLSGWIAAGGLGLWSLWPSERPTSRVPLHAGLFAVAFALVTAPLWLGPDHNLYFSRLGKFSPLKVVENTTAVWRSIDTAETAMSGPWWTPDPLPRHDLPDRSRLGWIVGIPVAAAFLWSLLSARAELSGWLLSSAAAALGSSVLWGGRGMPNSYRYVYLTTPTAVAAATGLLWLMATIPTEKRRAAAFAIAGVVCLGGILGARDALLKWPVHPATFAGFNGSETLIGRAAGRWDTYGTVVLDPEFRQSERLIHIVRRYRLGPPSALEPRFSERSKPRPIFRVSGPLTKPEPGERLVEHVRDGWGREWAIVLGRAGS